jgi:hypothetical protein
MDSGCDDPQNFEYKKCISSLNFLQQPGNTKEKPTFQQLKVNMYEEESIYLYT